MIHLGLIHFGFCSGSERDVMQHQHNKLEDEPQRYITDRVSYKYLYSKAVFQLLLFQQVTSGGISWSCFITLSWLYAHELFLQSYFIVDIAMHNFSTRGQKGFDKKLKLNFDLTTLWCLEGYSKENFSVPGGNTYDWPTC